MQRTRPATFDASIDGDAGERGGDTLGGGHQGPRACDVGAVRDVRWSLHKRIVKDERSGVILVADPSIQPLQAKGRHEITLRRALGSLLSCGMWPS